MKAIITLKLFSLSLSLSLSSLWGVIKTGILVKLLKLNSKINKSTIGNFTIWVYLSVFNVLHPKFSSLKQQAVLRESRSSLAGWVWLRISHKVAALLWPWTAVIWRLDQGQRICSPGLPHMAADWRPQPLTTHLCRGLFECPHSLAAGFPRVSDSGKSKEEVTLPFMTQYGSHTPTPLHYSVPLRQIIKSSPTLGEGRSTLWMERHKYGAYLWAP